MSKQLKFKLKKTLKKAEFVHADLEYHQELISEAKNLFIKETQRLTNMLSPEERDQIKRHTNARKDKIAEAVRIRQEENEKLKQIEEEITEFVNESGCTDLVTTDIEAEKDDKQETNSSKSEELKKLFRKIASETHPDKVAANGFSDKVVRKRERIFKKALRAYNDNNLYVLYSIALELDIKINSISQEYIDWIEEDIRNTMGEISLIGNQIAWVWYTGNGRRKYLALKQYFEEACSFNYPDLRSHIQN